MPGTVISLKDPFILLHNVGLGVMQRSRRRPSLFIAFKINPGLQQFLFTICMLTWHLFEHLSSEFCQKSKEFVAIYVIYYKYRRYVSLGDRYEDFGK